MNKFFPCSKKKFLYVKELIYIYFVTADLTQCLTNKVKVALSSES